MTGRVVETRLHDPAQTAVDLSLPDLDFGGDMPDAPADDDAYLDTLAAQMPGMKITTISGNGNGNGQHAPAIDDQFSRLTSHLWRGGAYAYFWTHPDKLSRWFEVGRPLPPIPNGRRNIYFGVHPIDTQKLPGQRSTIADITAINCLFAEYDAKAFGGDKSKAWARMEAVDPPASIIIDSGGGFHAYWLLKEPFIIQSEEERRRAQRIQSQWVAYAGGDDGAKDLARVLRVPGTRNYKPEYGPDFPAVKIVRADFEQYDLDTLEELAIFGVQSKNQTDLLTMTL